MHPFAIFLGILFLLMWSSAFSVAKIAVQDAPPLSLLTLRFLVSGALALALALMNGQTLPRGKGTWLAVVVLGVAQNALYLGLIFVAVGTIPAALAAIIASALPLLVAVAAPFVSPERPSKAVILGLLIGFGGVIYIMHDRVAGGVSPGGVVLCIVAVAALTLATLIVNRARFGGGLLMIVGLQMLVGAYLTGAVRTGVRITSCRPISPPASARRSPTWSWSPDCWRHSFGSS